MRPIRDAIRTLIVAVILGGITSAVAAAIARGRMFSHGEPADDEVELVAIYDSLNFESRAPALRQASVTVWYGGGTVDLRDAHLDPDGATIVIRALFGGLRLVVPETWQVELHTRAFAGGIGDARDTERIDPSSPVLTITGFAVFGGVAVLSEAPDLDREDDILEPAESVSELAGAPA